MAAHYMHALIPMSCKPAHEGHIALIELAASECEDVTCFVSVSDRLRTGEFPISGRIMHDAWISRIEPSLPGNVNCEYGGSPVGKVWARLGEADVDQYDEVTWLIYSDPTDIAENFPRSSFEKYTPFLVENELVTTQAVPRSSTVDISGTQMRKFLASGDRRSFADYLPSCINADDLWNELQAAARVFASEKQAKKSRKKR